MSQMPTITGLLEKAHAQFRVFDMGRRVTQLPASLFVQVEEGERPYPYPMQRRAWLGFLFWDPKQADQHFVWFLRFPLDELAQLQLAARDEFLDSVLQSLGNQPHQEGARIEQAHQESRFAFKPREERLAAFHAQALTALKSAPTRYYAHAREYLAGKTGFEQWAFVGLQGLADVVARLEQENNASLLTQAIPRLPSEPLIALCQLMENTVLNLSVARALRSRLIQAMDQSEIDIGEIAALLRGLGATDRSGTRADAYGAVLDSKWRYELEILVAISGRGWGALCDPELRLRFLECLARCQAVEGVFSQVVADLLFIPGMRPMLLESFRSPERSAELTRAIGELMDGVTNAFQS